jgi:hypothetical protein
VLWFFKRFRKTTTLKQPLYRYAEAEKTNGRWAMMATAGICGQELLGRGNWWEAGAAKYDMDFLPLLAIEFVVMSFFETKRYIGFKETGSVRPHTLFLFPLRLMLLHVPVAQLSRAGIPPRRPSNLIFMQILSIAMQCVCKSCSPVEQASVADYTGFTA